MQVAGDGGQGRGHDGLVEGGQGHSHHQGAEDHQDPAVLGAVVGLLVDRSCRQLFSHKVSSRSHSTVSATSSNRWMPWGAGTDSAPAPVAACSIGPPTVPAPFLASRSPPSGPLVRRPGGGSSARPLFGRTGPRPAVRCGPASGSFPGQNEWANIAESVRICSGERGPDESAGAWSGLRRSRTDGAAVRRVRGRRGSPAHRQGRGLHLRLFETRRYVRADVGVCCPPSLSGPGEARRAFRADDDPVHRS